jgi:hypothetical protein
MVGIISALGNDLHWGEAARMHAQEWSQCGITDQYRTLYEDVTA